MKYPSIEEMIEDCKKKQSDNEEIVFALGVGRMIPMLGKKKQMEKAFECIKNQEGFIGIHPIDLWKNLLIYRTLNDAKRAKNELRSKGCQIGNVAPILVSKEFIKGGNDSEKAE